MRNSTALVVGVCEYYVLLGFLVSLRQEVVIAHTMRGGGSASYLLLMGSVDVSCRRRSIPCNLLLVSCGELSGIFEGL